MSIKEQLGQDDIIRVLGIGRVAHHVLIQMIGMRGGFQGVWFDLEHVGMSGTELEVAALAARNAGLDCFCRIAPTDYAIVTRCLEAGASGIMAAQIFTVEQAEEIVHWTKFAPRGARGLNTGGFDADYAGISIPEFMKRSNAENFIAIQIETAESVEVCDGIAAIDGVDMLFVGPSDLSQSLGVPGEFFHEKCVSAIERVGAACRKHGKQWGAVSANPEHAKLLLEHGCKMLSPASDVKLISEGLNAVKTEYADFF